MGGLIIMAKPKNNQTYDADEVLQEIIYLAHHENDIAEFGINVAGVLYEQGCIDEAVYETLLGK